MPEIIKYLLNGVFATLVHFSVLTLGIEIFKMPASISNFIAAIFGITTSYLGSRYYVFLKPDQPMLNQAGKFFLLYGLIAIVHGLVLLVWSDIFKNSYQIGFLIATMFQVSMSYLGNKYLVFK